MNEVQRQHRTPNIEHRTPNDFRIEHPSMFGVRCSMFDVFLRVQSFLVWPRLTPHPGPKSGAKAHALQTLRELLLRRAGAIAFGVRAL
jgi:hypothetical protein